MNLKMLKETDTLNYLRWCQQGCPEASDSLNDGNRKTIKNYMGLFSNALGYKFREGFVDLNTEKHLNFFCDWVFNGTPENILRIKTVEPEFLQTGNPSYLTEALEMADGICLIWS